MKLGVNGGTQNEPWDQVKQLLQGNLPSHVARISELKNKNKKIMLVS